MDVFINVLDIIVEYYFVMIWFFFMIIVLVMCMFIQLDNFFVCWLFMMDEVVMLKGLEILKILCNVGCGYGIYFMLIYQIIGQIEEIWGLYEFSLWFDIMQNKVIGFMENLDGFVKFLKMFGQYIVMIIIISENWLCFDYQFFVG